MSGVFGGLNGMPIGLFPSEPLAATTEISDFNFLIKSAEAIGRWGKSFFSNYYHRGMQDMSNLMNRDINSLSDSAQNNVTAQKTSSAWKKYLLFALAGMLVWKFLDKKVFVVNRNVVAIQSKNSKVRKEKGRVIVSH